MQPGRCIRVKGFHRERSLGVCHAWPGAPARPGARPSRGPEPERPSLHHAPMQEAAWKFDQAVKVRHMWEYRSRYCSGVTKGRAWPGEQASERT